MNYSSFASANFASPGATDVSSTSSLALGGRCARVRNVLTGGVIFFLLSLPGMNQFTNRHIGMSDAKCPTIYTRVFHSVLYVIVLMMLMTHFSFSSMLPWGRVTIVSILSGLLFFFLASPDMYKLTSSMLRLGGDPGCPNQASIMLHSGVFMLVSYFLMCNGLSWHS